MPSARAPGGIIGFAAGLPVLARLRLQVGEGARGPFARMAAIGLLAVLLLLVLAMALLAITARS